MTVLQAIEDGASAGACDLLVVVGVGVDATARERLATAVDGAGLLMFAPDLETAHAMLGQQVQLRRAGEGRATAIPEVVRLGDLEVDRLRCQVRWRQEPFELSQRERDLLALLAAEPARVWTHEQLYEEAWGEGYLDAVPVHAAVKRLRRKLREAGVPHRVESVRGVGYQLLADGGRWSRTR